MKWMREGCFAVLGGVLVLASGFVTVAQAQQKGRTGQIDILYIRGEWGDKTMPLTDTEWQSRMTALNSFAGTYWTYHSSSGITSFAATITPRLTMSGPAPTEANPAEPWAVRSEMVSLAAAEGYDAANYDHVLLSYPSVAHTYSFGGLGTPGSVWLPGSNPWGPGFAHEMGHAFAVGHASHWEGGASILPGEHREGRDGLFMMGSEGSAAPIPPLNIGRSTINMPMRYVMEHVGSESIQMVATSGVVRLYEFELPTVPEEKMLAARVPVGGTVPGDWWISFCPTMAERWAAFNSGGYANGVIVQQLSGGITRSLDFTPQSQGGIGTNEEDYHDTRDGALQIGRAYTFSGTDVTIEPLRTGTTDGLRWIEVDIDLGPETGPLLLREEFDGYQPGSIIGQTGRGLGESGDWEYQGTDGTFVLGAGLSGSNGLVVTANGSVDAKITHNVPGWGTGVLYMSYLWNETAYGGHAYVSGGGSFPGAFGHAWSRAWGINNSGNGVGYSFNQTYRLVARIDWENNETTMWADPVDETDTPVAFKTEDQDTSPTLILRYHGTDGTIDDIRIGQTFDSVVRDIYEPPPPVVLIDPATNDGSFESVDDNGIGDGSNDNLLAAGASEVVGSAAVPGYSGVHGGIWTITQSGSAQQGGWLDQGPGSSHESDGLIGVFQDQGRRTTSLTTITSLLGANGYDAVREGDVLDFSFDHNGEGGAMSSYAALELSFDGGSSFVTLGTGVNNDGDEGTFQTSSGTYTATAADAAAAATGGLHVRLRVVALDGKIWADNVRLSVIPVKRITSLTCNPDHTVTLSWDSDEGATYTLRYADRLEAPVSGWAIENDAIPGDETTSTYRTTATFSGDAHFFAVEQNVP